jgi:hypothetical protein
MPAIAPAVNVATNGSAARVRGQPAPLHASHTQQHARLRSDVAIFSFEWGGYRQEEDGEGGGQETEGELGSAVVRSR